MCMHPVALLECIAACCFENLPRLAVGEHWVNGDWFVHNVSCVTM